MPAYFIHGVAGENCCPEAQPKPRKSPGRVPEYRAAVKSTMLGPDTRKSIWMRASLAWLGLVSITCSEVVQVFFILLICSCGESQDVEKYRCAGGWEARIARVVCCAAGSSTRTRHKVAT
jgi:hypothetical protein